MSGTGGPYDCDDPELYLRPFNPPIDRSVRDDEAELARLRLFALQVREAWAEFEAAMVAANARASFHDMDQARFELAANLRRILSPDAG